jgi:hypothetical protein
MKTVAVYGGAIVAPESDDYAATFAVGKALAEAGYAVMTGGYSGVMEAASRGASEAGGHVIGVTTERIESLRGAKINQWVVDEIRHPTLRERLMHLVLEADAYVVMPGGLGTLNELVTVWELIRVGDIPRRPLIGYGPFWREVLAPFMDTPYVQNSMIELIQFVQTPQAMIEALNAQE